MSGVGLVVGVLVDLADRGRPVLLAVDLGQHLGGQPVGRPVIDDRAELQSDDPLGEHLRQHHVVDVDDRRELALRAQLLDQPHDLPRGLRIERGGRLVDQQQFRILDQRPADADALALAAGQFVGALVGHVVEADARQQAERLVDVGLRKLAQPALPEPDIAEPAAQHVLHHAQPLDQRVFLEDHAHAPPRAAQLAAAERGELGVVERDRAGGRLDQPVDAADDGRFAGARGPDQRHHLAVGHVEVDALERQVAGPVALHQTLDPKHARPPGAEFEAAFGAWFARLAPSLASVFDAGGLVDLAQNRPVFFVFDRDELVFLLELGLQRRALPREAEERLLDLLDQLRVEVVDVAVAGGRETSPTCRSSGFSP